MKQITAYEATNGALFHTEEEVSKYETQRTVEAAREAELAAKPWLLRSWTPLLMVSFSVLCVWGFWSLAHKHLTPEARTAITHTNMPPGYKVACDSAGRYAYVDDRGILSSWPSDVFSSKLAVIKRAWEEKLFRDDLGRNRETLPKPIESDWKVCE